MCSELKLKQIKPSKYGTRRLEYLYANDSEKIEIMIMRKKSWFTKGNPTVAVNCQSLIVMY